MEIPVLPVHHVTGDGVVLAFWLDNFQRFFRCLYAVAAIIRARGHGNRHNGTFFNLLDLLLLKVDHSHQVLNRVRPVVAVADIQIAHHLQQAIFLLQAVFTVEIADGQRRGNHFFRVVDAVFFQHLGKLCALVDNLLHRGEIIQQHHAVRVFHRFPAQDFFILQIHHAFDNVLAVEHDDLRLARGIHCRTVEHKVPHFGFRWFRKGDLGKAGVWFKIRRGFHDLHGLLNFVRR